MLIAATYLRVVGMNWDANQHLHPDERFLTMVETALQVKKCACPTCLWKRARRTRSAGLDLGIT